MSHRYLQRAVKYSIIADLCVECTACRSECPVGCITGHPKKEHFIDLNLCIFCGGYLTPVNPMRLSRTRINVSCAGAVRPCAMRCKPAASYQRTSVDLMRL